MPTYVMAEKNKGGCKTSNHATQTQAEHKMGTLDKLPIKGQGNGAARQGKGGKEKREKEGLNGRDRIGETLA